VNLSWKRLETGIKIYRRTLGFQHFVIVLKLSLIKIKIKVKY